MQEILRKVKVLRKVSSTEYEAQDVLNEELVSVLIKGKLRMNYIKLAVNQTVFIVARAEAPQTGTLIVEKYICLHNPESDLCLQKRAIEQQEREIALAENKARAAHFVKPVRVRGTIVQVIDNYNYLVYVKQFERDVHTKISAKLLLHFRPSLKVGAEMVIEVNPKDPSQGRFFNRSHNLFGYE